MSAQIRPFTSHLFTGPLSHCRPTWVSIAASLSAATSCRLPLRLAPFPCLLLLSSSLHPPFPGRPFPCAPLSLGTLSIKGSQLLRHGCLIIFPSFHYFPILSLRGPLLPSDSLFRGEYRVGDRSADQLHFSPLDARPHAVRSAAGAYRLSWGLLASSLVPFAFSTINDELSFRPPRSAPRSLRLVSLSRPRTLPWMEPSYPVLLEETLHRVYLLSGPSRSPPFPSLRRSAANIDRVSQ